MGYSTWADLPDSISKDINNMDMTVKAIFQTVDDYRKQLLECILQLPSVTDKKELPRESGVYFYIHDREILYIGKSIDLRQRWTVRRDYTIDSQYVVYYLVKNRWIDLDHWEGLFIFLFAPRYNRNVNNKVNYYYFNNYIKTKKIVENNGW